MPTVALSAAMRGRAASLRAMPMTFVRPPCVRGMASRSRPSAGRRVASGAVTAAAVLAGAAFAVYCLDSRAGVHRWIFPKAMELLTDPETGAKFSIGVLEHGLAPRDCVADDEVLRTELFGRTLTNPIGLAAGFDKQAQAVDGLFDLGFGIVEIGSVTPEPQPGQPKPRMFRLPLDHAVINRMGFNSEGHEAVRERLDARMQRWVQRVLGAGQGLISNLGTEEAEEAPAKLRAAQLLAGYPVLDVSMLDAAGVPRSLKEDRLLSVNLGKNKTSREDSPADYVEGVRRLGPYADMLVINVSSPNTPGLRRLQRRSVLEGLLRDVVAARNDVAQHRPTTLPLLVKVAPDLSDAELEDIADAAEASHIDGVIVSNTTVSRPTGLLSRKHVEEVGGLSGPPLKPLALHALEVMYRRSGGRLTLIGSGGIASAADALDFARAGASAVQLYTALAYHGPGLPRRIKDDLVATLRAQNTTWSQIVGTGLAEVPAYAPDAQRVGLYPGAPDALERSVASVRHELEQLRETLGVQTHGEERRALPFALHKGDEDYATLLDEAHAALDGEAHWAATETPHAGVLPAHDSAVPADLLAFAQERGSTQGEALHEAVQQAVEVPQAAPGVQDSGKPDETLGGLEAQRAAPLPAAEPTRVV
ncbi:Similar to S.cerevisiae protein URA1 (Dihydroorotate dehydrogenase) [Malassezia sympodialis ATCC 42132]|uniref:Dihydroorotate dehydrogenase (quinone), mitochondrial n=2 Tax=Malassezia sympodialis (strain ATCC 42132) TaxID=1230383 RepID=A0A1M8A6I0_MALS4|nr:Similar to S.cerevisiae protein URA1 (Dihydroorotate dehydrogenase) [Malassezia sympodialis ATCC 42132]